MTDISEPDIPDPAPSDPDVGMILYMAGLLDDEDESTLRRWNRRPDRAQFRQSAESLFEEAKNDDWYESAVYDTLTQVLQSTVARALVMWPPSIADARITEMDGTAYAAYDPGEALAYMVAATGGAEGVAFSAAYEDEEGGFYGGSEVGSDEREGELVKYFMRRSFPVLLERLERVVPGRLINAHTADELKDLGKQMVWAVRYAGHAWDAAERAVTAIEWHGEVARPLPFEVTHPITQQFEQALADALHHQGLWSLDGSLAFAHAVTHGAFHDEVSVIRHSMAMRYAAGDGVDNRLAQVEADLAEALRSEETARTRAAAWRARAKGQAPPRDRKKRRRPDDPPAPPEPPAT